MIIDAWMQHPTGDPFYRRLVVTALLHRMGVIDAIGKLSVRRN
jgi:hypothetical protein